MPPAPAKSAKARKRRPALPYRHPRRTREEHSHEIAQDYVEIIAELIAATGEARVIDVARRLGVTHVTVARTIQRLQREGLVEAEPNHRVRVADFSIPDLEQLYAMRISLEALAIRLTVPFLQIEELRRLEGYLTQMAGLPTPEEYERWEVPHRAFHLSLVAHAGARIVTMIAQLSDHAERYRRFYSTEAPRAFERGMREHEAIVDACLARDPGLAAERLARHYSSVALGTLAVLAPEYDPVLVRTALHSVMQARTGGKNGAQNSK